MLHGGEGAGARGFDVDGVRLNSRFVPFAVPKGLKGVIAEVEEGVEV